MLPPIETDRKWASSIKDPVSYKDRYFPCNSLVWNPNDFLPDFLSRTRPLLDRTHTPRSAKKAISLERIFDKEIWIPTTKHMNMLTQGIIDKDKKKGKQIARMIRYKKRAAASGKMLAQIKNSLLKDIGSEKIKMVTEAEDAEIAKKAKRKFDIKNLLEG